AFLRVEVINEVLIREHLLAQQKALAGINAAEIPRRERTPADNDGPLALVFEQNQIVITKRQQSLARFEVFQNHVRPAIVAEAERFQRRVVALEAAQIDILGGVEL